MTELDAAKMNLRLARARARMSRRKLFGDRINEAQWLEHKERQKRIVAFYLEKVKELRKVTR